MYVYTSIVKKVKISNLKELYLLGYNAISYISEENVARNQHCST
jgi:hypothetical protein